MNPWIEFVKKYASDNKMKYNEALKSSDLKVAYLKSKGDNLPAKKTVKKTGVKKVAMKSVTE